LVDSAGRPWDGIESRDRRIQRGLGEVRGGGVSWGNDRF